MAPLRRLDSEAKPCHRGVTVEEARERLHRVQRGCCELVGAKAEGQRPLAQESAFATSGVLTAQAGYVALT